jgi:hypothetical protein
MIQAHTTSGMNYLQYGEKYGRPRYPSPHTVSGFNHDDFTQTPTPLNQSPQLGDHGQVNPAGLSIQSPIIGVANDNASTTTSELAVFPAEEEATVPVSTAFHPTAYPQLPPVDIILSSSDGVLFFVHSGTILGTCESAFRQFLGSPLDSPKFRDTFIPMASTSAELNIILHMVYGMSPASYFPAFDILAGAVDSMPGYSITPREHILPGTPLYILLLSHAPLRPLDVYALAAHHNIHPLAVMTSSHLLSYSLQTITDSQADRMGAVYLKKLMILHVDRFNTLKSVLLELPHPHPPTRDCDFSAQKKLTRSWCLVSAHLAWDARPGNSLLSLL